MDFERVEINGFAMNYFRFGTGPRNLVILPGVGIQSVMGAAEAVREEYKLFEDDFTIYVFDRREEVPPVYPVREMARDTAAVLAAIGLRDLYLFGASQGGMMAQVIAIEHPDLVKKMVLGSTSAHVTDEQYRALENWSRLARERDAVGLYLDFGRELYPPETFESYRNALVAAGESVTEAELDRFIILADGTKGFDVVSELDAIRCPVMVIGVYEDAVLDSDATMEIAEQLDAHLGFRLYMYKGYGHAAFDTAPDYRERLYRFFMD